MPTDTARLAVLVDADNTSFRHAGAPLEEVAGRRTPNRNAIVASGTAPLPHLQSILTTAVNAETGQVRARLTGRRSAR